MSFGFGSLAMIRGGAIAAVGFIPIALGLRTTGVVSGNVAAATQSSIGAVSAGSTSATMTSLGKTRTLARVCASLAGAGAAISAPL